MAPVVIRHPGKRSNGTDGISVFWQPQDPVMVSLQNANFLLALAPILTALAMLEPPTRATYIAMGEDV